MTTINTYILQEQNSNYFNVIDIPQVFSKGINSFKLRVNQKVFEQGQRVYIYITDKNGKQIPNRFYDVTINYARVITVYITQDIQNGQGLITIIGTLADVPGE